MKTSASRNIFFFWTITKMPKKITKKIFKVKKTKDLDYDHLVVKFKGLDKADVRQLRSDLDDFLGSYLEENKEEQTKET